MPQRFNGLLDRLMPADDMGGLLSSGDAQAAQRQAQMALASGLLQAASPSRMPISFGGAIGSALPQAMHVQSERQMDALRNQQFRESILDRNKKKAAQEKLMGLLNLAGDEGKVIGLLGEVSPDLVVKGLLDRYLAPTQAQGPESPIGKLFADRDALAARGNTEGVKAIDTVIQREIGSQVDLAAVTGARNDMIRNSEPFLEAQKGFQSVMTGATSATPAGDVALVFGFMKTLDPKSTVREGEFATAEQTRGVPDSIRGIYNKVITGERLTPEQRADFIAQARGQFAKVRDQHLRVIEDARGFAQRNKLSVMDIVPEYLLPMELPAVPQAPPPAAPAPSRSWSAPLLPREQDALGKMLQNLGMGGQQVPPLPPGFTLDQ
jgi:hypothetical protein